MINITILPEKFYVCNEPEKELYSGHAYLSAQTKGGYKINRGENLRVTFNVIFQKCVLPGIKLTRFLILTKK